ncbi:penicillin-binding protein 2 [Patescibacteria group bacterium]|nr:penicillin-binding protein 2 [Patescibacteria group bacterium]
MSDPFSISPQDKNIKGRRLANFSRGRVLGDYMPGSESESSRPMFSPIEKGRIYTLFILIFSVILIIFIRLLWLQIISGDDYRDLAEGNRIRVLPIKADRGLIYDKNLQPLVKNVPNFSLIVIPGDWLKNQEQKNKTIDKLLTLLKIDSSDDQKVFLDIFSNLSPYSYQPVMIKEKLDYQTAMALRLELEQLPGIVLEIKAQREYLPGQYFPHLLGYVGKISPEKLESSSDYLLTDLIGKTGLELYYEDVLKGVDGQKRVEVNSWGKEERIESYRPPVTGQDLILSIDADLQKKIAEVLIKYIKINRSSAGAAVALNPQTGEVISIFSWPNYDNNIFITGTAKDYQQLADNPNKPFVFRAIAGEYPPGSVIKPVIVAGALDQGIIDRQTKINSVGGITIGQWVFNDWKEGGHGLTDLTKALAESVNTFFYYIGGGFKNFEGLGVEGINHYTRLFGLAKITGIDLPGESQGFIATPEWKERVKKERWYIGDTYHLAIGQGDILVTPLQVANYTAAIANGGILFKPQIVKIISDPETGQEKPITSEIIRQEFIDAEYLDLIRRGLRAAVTQGSARRLASLKIKVAGKTGTAQVGGNKKSHAWFTGFAPYENPEIVLTILIENGGEGSVAAVPAAKEILEFWIKQRNL